MAVFTTSHSEQRRGSGRCGRRAAEHCGNVQRQRARRHAVRVGAHLRQPRTPPAAYAHPAPRLFCKALGAHSSVAWAIVFWQPLWHGPCWSTAASPSSRSCSRASLTCCAPRATRRSRSWPPTQVRDRDRPRSGRVGQADWGRVQKHTGDEQAAALATGLVATVPPTVATDAVATQRLACQALLALAAQRMCPAECAYARARMLMHWVSGQPIQPQQRASCAPRHPSSLPCVASPPPRPPSSPPWHPCNID